MFVNYVRVTKYISVTSLVPPIHTLNVEGPAQMLWMTSKRLQSTLTLMLKRHVIHRLVGDFAM